MKNFKTKLMAIALSITCIFAVILGIKLPTAFPYFATRQTST